MKFILLLIIAAVSIYCLYLYFSNEISKLKHKLLLISKYNEKLKKELSINKKKNIRINFSSPENSSGLLNDNIKIFIAPLMNSSVISSTTSKVEANIIDECIIDDISWVYIRIPSDSNINCHGWVKKDNFNMFYCDNLDVSIIHEDSEGI
ncbi:hypothetical protein SAMN04487886_10593 [Clostridium sp. DSM 8431]|uniref:hypothetical protein n=1 Tax=Clostridium sp. DSM 8431 TaxID=1761781 RepID=UPI0008EA3442|nr:hypothetical protein [Clostridium sp. DSM 8431]SFU56417.1 hypothetical protein SAMN04487886_10593 [Clostridium sp. DSM 8431]